jgi:hypothetical protein
LFELGFDDCFYECVLRYSPLLKSFLCGIGSTHIFNQYGGLNVGDMLEAIIMNKGSMDIQDMIDYLEQEYGVITEKYKLKKCIRNSNLYYSEAMERIYIDYDEFYGEM